MQLLFWCNTVADRNHAYSNLRRLLDRILTRYFEKDDKSALYLNALYFETLYVLTSIMQEAKLLIYDLDKPGHMEAVRERLAKRDAAKKAATN